MIKPAPVIIVDDDPDEHDLIKEVWKELKLSYPLISFSVAQQLLDYLQSDKQIPFLIISDINLHPIDGFELREKILGNESSKFKSVPFIFWSGSATEDQIKKAFNLSSHGFFLKASTIHDLKDTIKDIIVYWQKSEIPYFRGQH